MQTVRTGMISVLVLLFIQWHANAQFAGDNVILQSIKPYHIAISDHQTTHIIFPFAIQSVDRGSAWVLAQKAKGVDNILQLKAGQKNSVSTNVSIVTSDGQFYSFLCAYAASASCLNIKIERSPGKTQSLVQLSGVPLDEAHFEQIAGQLVNLPRRGNQHAKGQQLLLTMRGVFIHTDLLWLTFRLLNQSHILYHPSQMRFFVRDRKRSRRTAIQEKEIMPVFTSGDSTVLGKQVKKFAVAFRPFVIPRSQELVMEVTEQDGSRPITLRLKYRHLLRTKFIQ